MFYSWAKTVTEELSDCLWSQTFTYATKQYNRVPQLVILCQLQKKTRPLQYYTVQSIKLLKHTNKQVLKNRYKDVS